MRLRHGTGPRNDFTGITPAKSGRYGAAKCDVAIRHSRGPLVRACLPNRLPACLPCLPCLPACLPACLACLPALPCLSSCLPACLPLTLPSLLSTAVYRWFLYLRRFLHGLRKGESSSITVLITDDAVSCDFNFDQLRTIIFETRENAMRTFDTRPDGSR